MDFVFLNFNLTFLFNLFSWEKLGVRWFVFLGFFLVGVFFQVFLKDDLLLKAFGIL